MKKIDDQHLIAKLALNGLSKISRDLDQYAYEADVAGVIEHYPTPFYEAAYSLIKATDIVTNRDEYWPRRHWEKMIDLNVSTLKRMRRTAAAGIPPAIKRVFILPDDLSDERTTEAQTLMDCLAEEGVEVRSIDYISAHALIQQASSSANWDSVFDVEDFSIFDASQGKVRYAGRFRDRGRKTVVITTDQRVIKELEEQFDLLWKEATLHVSPEHGVPPFMHS